MAVREAAHATVPRLAASDSCRLEAEFDLIVEAVYRAAAGLEPWEVPLGLIADASDAMSVGFVAFDKATGAILFSHSAGRRPSEALSEYIRAFHGEDPRLALLRPMAVGQWLACQDHIDEAFVARSPFYQKFLLRFGMRYAYATKLIDDERTTVAFAHHRAPGNPLVDPAERGAIQRIARHIAAGQRLRTALDEAGHRDALGYALLDRLHQPVILLDCDRRIRFRSERAKALLAQGDPVAERDGILFCRDAASNTALTLALRELTVLRVNPHPLGSAPQERRTLSLMGARGTPTVATLLGVCPREMTGVADGQLCALLVVHQLAAIGEFDPAFLATAFRLTPAEARVAARVASGRSVDLIAAEAGVAVATVRAQIAAIFAKTGVRRQSELIRVLLAASAL